MTHVRLGNNGKHWIEQAIEADEGGSIPDPLELGAAVFAQSVAVGVEDTDGFITIEPASIGVYLDADDSTHDLVASSGSNLTALDSSLSVDVSSGDLSVGPWKVLIETSNFVIRPGNDNRAAQFGSAAFPIYYIFTALPTSDPGNGGMWVNSANHNAVTVGSGA